MGGATAVATATPRAAILVVDDEPDVARSTERALVAGGYHVTVAISGQDAIRKAYATSFDAIVSDLLMPDIDGRQLLRTIRTRNLDVPFIFLTGSPNLQSAIEAIEYGAFRYLLKPVSLRDLLAVVGRAVGWHRWAAIRREAAPEMDGRRATDRAGLEARFASALDALYIVTQPIVSSQASAVLAYEALVRSDGPIVRNPDELFGLAERLDRTSQLGRAIRGLVAAILPSAPDSRGGIRRPFQLRCVGAGCRQSRHVARPRHRCLTDQAKARRRDRVARKRSADSPGSRGDRNSERT